MNFVNHTLWGEFFFLLLPPSLQNIFLKNFSIVNGQMPFRNLFFKLVGTNRKVFAYHFNPKLAKLKKHENWQNGSS